MVVTRRTRETQTITVDGAAGPRSSETISESIDQILCAWCGDGESVSELGRTGAI